MIPRRHISSRSYNQIEASPRCTLAKSKYVILYTIQFREEKTKTRPREKPAGETQSGRQYPTWLANFYISPHPSRCRLTTKTYSVVDRAVMKKADPSTPRLKHIGPRQRNRKERREKKAIDGEKRNPKATLVPSGYTQMKKKTRTPPSPTPSSSSTQKDLQRREKRERESQTNPDQSNHKNHLTPFTTPLTAPNPNRTTTTTNHTHHITPSTHHSSIIHPNLRTHLIRLLLALAIASTRSVTALTANVAPLVTSRVNASASSAQA